MTTNELDSIFESTFQQITELSRSKGADYASEADRLSKEQVFQS